MLHPPARPAKDEDAADGTVARMEDGKSIEFGRRSPAHLLASADPMRILIHGMNYAPEFTGVGRYTGEIAAHLAARGASGLRRHHTAPLSGLAHR